MKMIALVTFGLAITISRPMSLNAEGSNTATTLKVAVVQLRSSRDLSDNLTRITNSIHECARQGARVVVFPECALSGYFEDAVTNLSAEQLTVAAGQMAQACRQAGVYGVLGTAWRDGEKLFDSALIIAPSGKVIERYDKIQLAERWPQPGDHSSVFKVDGVPCSVIICHDERYPELVRLPVLAGAQVVFYLSHESGLREERKLNPYRAQIQARAVENTVFVVQANAPANPDASGSHGQSRVVAPDGNIVQEASIFDEDVITATLDLRKATRANARKSLERGPFQDWWREGIQRVRMIE
jgi:predicted amidohydrolase